MQEFKNEVIKVAEELEDSGVFKNSHELPTHQHIFLQEVLEEKLADWRWPDALFELTELLHTLHKRKVVVLVDEYDTPMSYAMRHGYFPEVCLYPALEHNLVFQCVLQANYFFQMVSTQLLKVGTFCSAELSGS